MALPLPRGLTAPEVAFLCENTPITIIPRQRLDSIQLIGTSTPPLHPSRRANVPLWFALLLKRQRRANILPPPWLTPQHLQDTLDWEKTHAEFSPSPTYTAHTLPPSKPAPISDPFLPTSIASTSQGSANINLPYHWLEISHILLREAQDDIPLPEQIVRLIRDLREVRMAKVRAGIGVLEGNREVEMTGVGGFEVAEGKAFITGVVDGLRLLGASREAERLDRDEEADEEADQEDQSGQYADYEDDDGML